MAEPSKKLVLVVDDDKEVRELIATILPDESYHVVFAESAKKALEFAGHLSVDLLMTDAMLPNMKGRDLANRICTLQPAVKVLFLSGYSAETLINHGIFPSGAYSLGKPITEKSLLTRVRTILEEGEPWKKVAATS